MALAAPLLASPPEAAGSGLVVPRPDRASRALRLLDAAVLGVAAASSCRPFGAVAWSGRSIPAILDGAMLRALATSVLVALPAAGLALGVSPGADAGTHRA